MKTYLRQAETDMLGDRQRDRQTERHTRICKREEGRNYRKKKEKKTI